MNIHTLKRLLKDAEQRATAEDSQYWQGRADSYREMLNAEIEIKRKSLYMATGIDKKEGSPAFIKAYNRAANAQGLPLLA